MLTRANLRAFWTRTTEGLSAEQLWTQFRRETRTSISLYSAESGRNIRADWSARKGRFSLVRAVAAAMFARLTPVRRILLLVALVCLLIPQVEYTSDTGLKISVPLAVHGGLILLFLLLLELADRVGLKRDLEIARDIQRMLLPAEPPSVAGIDIAFATKPANTVAGDYYDAFLRSTADGPRLLFVVADVAGKGIPAGLLMASVQTGLHMLAEENAPLEDIAGRLNRAMCRRSGTGRHFTTAFIAELDCRNRDIAWVNAGQNTPFLVRATGAIERPEEGGFPLGIFETAEYTAGHSRLNPGDALYVYSDGVVEAFNNGGAEFGEERLAKLCGALNLRSAKTSLERIFQSVEQFAGDEPRSDDITCLVLHVEAAGAAASADR